MKRNFNEQKDKVLMRSKKSREQFLFQERGQITRLRNLFEPYYDEIICKVEENNKNLFNSSVDDWEKVFSETQRKNAELYRQYLGDYPEPLKMAEFRQWVNGSLQYYEEWYKKEFDYDSASVIAEVKKMGDERLRATVEKYRAYSAEIALRDYVDSAIINEYCKDKDVIFSYSTSPIENLAKEKLRAMQLPLLENEMKERGLEIEPEKGKPVEEVTPEQSENLNALRTALNEYFDSGKRPENDRFIVGKTPFVLQMTGSRVTEVTVPVSVIKKASEAHGLSREEIYESLANIYNPILIFDSDKKSTENKVDSKLVLTDIFKDEKPLALAVNVNSFVQEQKNGHRQFFEVQDIRSIHDRTVIAKNGTDLIQKWTNDGLCRYIDDKKISGWSTVARIYFPIEALQSPKNNILTKSDLVNSIAQSAEKSINQTNIEGDKTMAQEKQSQTWMWKDWDDGSGHLESPDGKAYFIYDLSTKEYKTTRESSWDSFVDADPTRDTSLAAFKEYAEEYIKKNVIKDESVEIKFEKKFLSADIDPMEQAEEVFNGPSVEPFSEKETVFTTENAEEFSRFSESSGDVGHITPEEAKEMLSILSGEGIKITYEPVPDDIFISGNAEKHGFLENQRISLAEIRALTEKVEQFDYETEKYQADFKFLTDVLSKGSGFVKNTAVGEITFESGETGKSGYGLKHIIEQRFSKDGRNEDEITALMVLVKDVSEHGRIVRENGRNIELQTDNGIVSIVRKESEDKQYKWVLTGFDDYKNKEASTDAIQTVIAKYGYLPEYSSFRTQVGTVIASLNQNISQMEEKSSLADDIMAAERRKEAWRVTHGRALPTDDRISVRSSENKRVPARQVQGVKKMEEEIEAVETSAGGTEQTGAKGGQQSYKVHSYWMKNAQLMYGSIKDGSNPALSKAGMEKDGTIVLMPEAVRSASTGKALRGNNQLIAQMALAKLGLKDREVLTYNQAGEKNIRRGAKYFVLTTFDSERKEAPKMFSYYPVSAVVDASRIPNPQDFAKTPYEREKLKKVTPLKHPDQTFDARGEVDPQKYVGKYLAACAMGTRFVTDEKTVDTVQAALVKRMEPSVTQKTYGDIYKFGNEASLSCREFCSEMHRSLDRRADGRNKNFVRHNTNEIVRQALTM